jgi:hypothetical protein
MTFRARGLAATAILFVAFAGPAAAEIEKFMSPCGPGKLCASFRASITVPDGWVEDKEASRELGVQMLLPKGKGFDEAPAKIYAMVHYNREKKAVSTFLPAQLQQWRGLAKDARIEKLSELKRADGKSVFLRHKFQAPSLKEQAYEQVAVTSDGDKDGNAFVVVITLSSDTREAFEAAQEAYQAILAKY